MIRRGYAQAKGHAMMRGFSEGTPHVDRTKRKAWR